MKDNDHKTLGSIYGSIVGEQQVVIFESADNDFLTEELVQTLGSDNARRLVGLVKRELPACNDDICAQRLEKLASQIINTIKRTVSNSMIRRTLSQYDQLSPLAQAKVLYSLLSNTK